MKFSFKIQQYQTDAVTATVDVFGGQPFRDSTQYTRDLGVQVKEEKKEELLLFEDTKKESEEELESAGFRNADVTLSDEKVLANIAMVQARQNIKQSPRLVKDFDAYSLDVEMETGTGKTYVYIKTMFELNKQYGWSKFIVVVPSIAIREGVKKSFDMTVEHFMEHYGKKARYFVYNSSNLNQLDKFSSDAGINVMIINTQAFAASMKEGGKSKESRIIYTERDEFGSRRPIDVIAANRPIIIMDEPQKMGGDATRYGIARFKPLFTLNYSATHKNHHNEIFVLDALDAYNKKLVKKIQVKGIELHNIKGTTAYLYLEKIIISPNKPPMAKMEIDVLLAGGTLSRRTITVGTGDDLYYLSKELQAYKGFSVSEIDPINCKVSFVNGVEIHTGDIVGDGAEKDIRRVQIRETIESHFEKEEQLFNKGIKTLSLFFIDEVAKYRVYDEDGAEQLGEYGKIFEEEYNIILNQKLSLFDSEYQKYLRGISVGETHRGYFSIDKKTGRSINSEIKRGSDFSDDISAYDLILKNKERLLSFEEPTRFIFSHSALREGWDNPNVFQICTLKHSDSGTLKRQEVGRGLRLAVNKDGIRMDLETLGEESVHDINKLTVVASESYASFVTDLQKETKDVLYERPTKATTAYFEGKKVATADGTAVVDNNQAALIVAYLTMNGYIDATNAITPAYRAASESGTLAPMTLFPTLVDKEEGIHKLVKAIFDPSVLDDMVENGHDTKVTATKLNDNFNKKEFQELWKKINHKYAYTVKFDSEELIKKSIDAINGELVVAQVRYSVTTGTQSDTLTAEQIKEGTSFGDIKKSSSDLKNASECTTKYDIVGKIAAGAKLTRKTASRILTGISRDKQVLFAVNPEEFIAKVSSLIISQKATMIVEDVHYNEIEGEYDSSIFTLGVSSQGYSKAIGAKRHITDYVFPDSDGEKNFCEELETHDEVCVYAKLPKGFSIPTPVGSYSPDWAIAFNKDTVRHVFFIAETKGSMDSLQLKKIEEAKIKCAEKLFNDISTDRVRYHKVSTYSDMLNVMQTIK